MNTSKIIKAIVNARGQATTAQTIKENYGIVLKIEGTELPEVYQVDFCNEGDTRTITMVGNADGVLIPKQFIDTGKDIDAYLYYVGDGFGKTVYQFHIPNKYRPDRTEETPTPEEQSVIDQAISALNEAVAQTAQDAESANQSAQSASDAADRAEQARDDAQTAQRKAEEAQESSERAKDDAETSERNASESERKAKGYADTASEKADAITGLTAQATTLPDGSSATANYNPETGVMSFGIPKGKDGTDGDDGYSPTANVSKTGKVTTITITDKNGTTSAQVEDGTDGIDGVSPSVSVTDITGGHRVDITDGSGSKTFDVMDGATGATPNLTIGTVETLEPTESATANITGTPENPVLNLGIPQGEQGEVSIADLNTALMDKADIITDTVSGSIASFPDGADNLPLKSLAVDINPIQDLHGQDAPYPAGGGKNKLQVTANTTTKYGVTFTVMTDGTVVANGTATQTATFEVGTYIGEGVAVIASGCPSGGNRTDKYRIFNTYIGSDEGGGSPVATPNVGDSCKVTLYVYAGYTATNLVFKPMIRLSSVTDATFAPYENICPISGWTQVGVEQRGKNLWSFNSSYSPTGYQVILNMVPFDLKAGTYTFSAVPNLEGDSIVLFGYHADGTRTEIARLLASTTRRSVAGTISKDVVSLYFVSNRAGTISDIQLELGSSATPYEPYTGRSITIDLGQTVYGGHLDVLTGELVVDRAYKTYDGTENWNAPNNNDPVYYALWNQDKSIGNQDMTQIADWLVAGGNDYQRWGTYRAQTNGAIVVGNLINKVSGNYKFANATDFKAYLAEHPLTVCYKIAEPVTIQLTPNQINSLYGVNNIWADSGDTEVVYRADTKLFIERLTAPDSADMIADANITSGKYFMVGNNLYKATANIANGSAIIVGTNCIRKSLSEALNEINA